MADVSLEPGQSIDDLWIERARGLPSDAREALLAKADAMRDEPEGAATARACYHALCDSLDVDQARDAERAIWLFEQDPIPDPTHLALARRAANADLGTELWFQGVFRTAQITRELGDVVEATRQLYALLAEVAGQGDRWEGLVAANLALCLQQQDREVETLVLCRRAILHFERVGELQRIIRCRQLVLNILASFHDWRRFDREYQRVQDEVEELPEEKRPPVQMADLLIRSHAAFERQQFDTVLENLEEVEARFPHRTMWVKATRAYVYAVMGRSDAARAELKQEDGAPRYRAQYGLLNDTTLMLASIAGDTVSTAKAAAVDYLELVRNGGDPPGNRVTMLLKVAEELGRREGLEHLAKLAYDLAASAMFERIHEVDRFARERPTLIELSAEERGMLGELRIRLLAQQEELMRAVAKLIKDARRRGEPMPNAWYGRDGLLCVCAWCGCMKRGDDGWIPIGPFFPDDRTLDLTHDICPKCYEERADEEHHSPAS